MTGEPRDAPRVRWPTSGEDLVEAQERLATASPTPWESTGADSVGASFCCFASDRQDAAGTRGWGSACSFDSAGDPAESAVVEGRAGAPYVPGVLALREGPLREAALRRLQALPDVLLVNATGRDHPRRAGLALHLGAVLDVPTVGLTDRPLRATGDDPPDTAGARSPLLLDGAVIGYWVRTRAGAAPVAVHAGWRTTPEVAAAVVLATVRGARTPEPMRLARRLAREARSRATTR